ncbi:MAG: shikimate dehydrogenase [ANME-2 cluster archaeon]|nr:shikimate dehydrogenase [ANME-2 cluster archaeon]MBC2702077.1 shikimate dehydrogenase [ANME-2 cluster archaeon]MBC2708847.1 shikimate dehydrogenase [ANME-2 cluster archaeon]MBC2748198.1 shikimate dehydrogenase [ANME-2 cluster archaeon]MBC2763084.1 shikimate dehydrogenase [ANME-2 cluster archaeon]
MKTIFAVLGDPVEHSLSPVMHNAAYKALGMDCEYHKFRVTPDDLEGAIKGARAMGFGGLNLTIPLKEKALGIVEPDTMAQAIGAVNTIEFSDDTIAGITGIVGYNTDGIGAVKALAASGVDIPGSMVLILGAGGAARAVAYQLAKDGARVIIANRTLGKSQELAGNVRSVGDANGTSLEELPELTADADIIINTTSVGMHPDIEQTLITADMMHTGQVIFDIVYSPLETRLLREAKKVGAVTIDGIKMLVLQGAESFRIWTGIEPPVGVMEQAVRDVLGSK